MVSEQRGSTPADELRGPLSTSKTLPVTTNLKSMAGSSSSATQACSAVPRMPHSMSPQSRSSVPRYKQQNTEMCSKLFSIDGERLKKMFRFCPKCGARIESDGCFDLRRIGAAPFVTVCCSNCTRLAVVA
ncbi:hypothetical protein ANCCAN_05852 [Ancylostoma caninum]|uniref:Uncharacterized protein n=1 Tax=Ancylostoma caninum TaxID=29170 RepID=A0A368GUH7_ANCCA|nr:hypothetical protein ANCCAN_05852 [Ancylostoma caninum]